MSSRLTRLLLLGAALTASIATSEPLPGDLGSECTTDQDCNAGLECVDDTCEYEATPAASVDCGSGPCLDESCEEHAWGEPCTEPAQSLR